MSKVSALEPGGRGAGEEMGGGVVGAERVVQAPDYLGQSFSGPLWGWEERPSTPGGRPFVLAPPTPGLGEGFPGQFFTTLSSSQTFNILNKISIPHQAVSKWKAD